MITVDFFISFGYGKRMYNEARQVYISIYQNSKDDINRVCLFRQSQGDEPNGVRRELIEENNQIQKNADQESRAIARLMVDAMNRRGLSENQVRELYRSG